MSVTSFSVRLNGNDVLWRCGRFRVQICSAFWSKSKKWFARWRTPLTGLNGARVWLLLLFFLFIQSILYWSRTSPYSFMTHNYAGQASLHEHPEHRGKLIGIVYFFFEFSWMNWIISLFSVRRFSFSAYVACRRGLQRYCVHRYCSEFERFAIERVADTEPQLPRKTCSTSGWSEWSSFHFSSFFFFI